MKQLPPLRKRGDLLILTMLLLCSLCLMLLPLRKQGTQAVIAIGGVTVGVVDLQQEQPLLSVTGAEGFLFCVNDHGISVTAAPCPSGLCCNSTPISAVGQCIICLPMQLTVTITDGEAQHIAPDAIIG